MIEQTNIIKFPDVGAALIVKNSEKSVSKAILSVKPVCRQIVVTDTGSLDYTPSVCSRNGAEIYFKSWTDDFSEARNSTLYFMRTEWIISIDSDEILDLESFYNNISLFDNIMVGGLRVRIINHLPDDTTRIHYFPRIFRNNKLIRFSGIIHEQIGESITDAGYEICNSDIIIHHYGYTNKNEDRIKRNTELIQKEINEKPDDDWLKYHQAETYFSAGKLIDAENIFKCIYDSEMLSSNQKDFCKIRLAQIALQNDNFQLSDKWSDFVSESADAEGLRLFIKTSSSLMQRKFKDAKYYFYQINKSNNNLINENIYTKINNLLNI